MMRKIFLLTVATGASLAVAQSPAHAQVRASERATVSQTVDGTTFTIDYARPRLRGRTGVFGKPIEWNEVWTPGANLNTTISANKAFTINGHPVPAGKYSVWMQVKQNAPWTFVLHKDTMRQHYQHPKVETAFLAFDFEPQKGAMTEVLTWSFPAVVAEGATVEMDWAEYHAPFTLRVTPTLSHTISPENAAPYVGTWDVEWLWNKDKPEKQVMTIRYNAADSSLYADSKMGKDDFNSILAQVTPNVFSPLVLMEGQVAEAAETMMVEFKRDGARAVTFEVRDKLTDQLQGRATRRN